jgi:hypothetical protein
VKTLFGILLLASCAPTLRDAERTITSDGQRFDSAIAGAVAQARRDAGANLLEAKPEMRMVEDGNPPPTTVPHPKVPELAFLVEPGPDGGQRLAHLLPVSHGCGSDERLAQFVYARAGARVRVIMIEPRATHPTIHVKGSCGMPGCGTQPPPPPLSLVWLPVASPAEIDVERRVVTGEVHRLTCDRPSYPP